MNISIIEKGLDEIEIIKPLWEQLNFVHINNSVFFKKEYGNLSFSERMKLIYNKVHDSIFKFDLILDNETGTFVGYCLSSIQSTKGDIESIYIDKQYRRLGLGDKLMRRALEWFKTNSIDDIKIDVVYANDEALPFYKCYGFDIKYYVLHKK